MTGGVFDGRDGRSIAGAPPVPTIALPAVRVDRRAGVATLDFGPGDAYYVLRRLPATSSAPGLWAVTLDGGYHFPHVNRGDYEPSIKLAIVAAVVWRARILAVREVMGQ
jgi:hypothetical protein